MKACMRSNTYLLVVFLMSLLASCRQASPHFDAVRSTSLRAPAYPLVTIDPYTSAWSFADRLNEDHVRHWTGKEFPLSGFVWIDEKPYRFMGLGAPSVDADVPVAAVQESAGVLPTQTYYTFVCGSVRLKVVFTAPLLLDDLQRMSTPVNYISYQVESLDQGSHDVRIVLTAGLGWARNTDEQEMDIYKELKNGFTYLKTGTKNQPVLEKKGDDVRIDWGYFYLAAASDPAVTMETAVNSTDAALLYQHDLGSVASFARGRVMIGYDDLYAIQYFQDNRTAYWKQNGQVTIYDAFEQAWTDYDWVMQRCRAFDDEMMKEAEAAGGLRYAELCALAYRQAIAAHKLVTDKEGNLLFLSKENFSNGSIGTVDVTYPSAPLFLLYNPDLLKGMLTPIFYFSESGKWNKPFAAHDVGTYPLANGQTYGGDMPVEECGNMLILTTAIALREGHADYAKAHWKVLTAWANYLVKEGLDPENQLCTDDFAGHFAHNTNLSVKAIMGIACYSKLAEMLGETKTAASYRKTAEEMARKWVGMADDGDHYRLTFDQPGTWSQKYNLVWDELLGLHLFPRDVAQTEIDYYLTRQQTYGLPLDSRKTYTKSDWIVWTACLATDSARFGSFIAPLYRYANETTARMPLSDWHETTDGKSVGFRARSVVGGYFMKMLKERLQ